MTNQQWTELLNIINGGLKTPLPTGFIIDSPWLPNWYGVKIIDYYSNDQIWFDANQKASETFSRTIFFPGFWSELGMCTEPSAFGSKCSFPDNEFPFAHKIILEISEIDTLSEPNPKSDGLLPFVLNRLKLHHKKIRQIGHDIKFAVARGPLNIASFLMGTTEFLTAMMLQPDKIHTLLTKITRFLKNWLNLQMESFSCIDGIFLLDDIIGFIGEVEFREFALPYFRELYKPGVAVKFLHNDAACGVSLKFLPEIGINLFNMAYDTDLNVLKKDTENRVTMLGNIPPRDVLASGSVEDVQQAAKQLLKGLDDTTRIIFSCGGGMPPGVSSIKINAFIDTIEKA